MQPPNDFEAEGIIIFLFLLGNGTRTAHMGWISIPGLEPF